MDRNSLLQSTFEIVIWPEIQDYMTIDNFRENAILINEEPFVDIVGSSAYFVNTEWKRKADLEIAYNNGWIDKEKLGKACELYQKNQYGRYLKDVLDGKYIDQK